MNISTPADNYKHRELWSREQRRAIRRFGSQIRDMHIAWIERDASSADVLTWADSVLEWSVQEGDQIGSYPTPDEFLVDRDIVRENAARTRWPDMSTPRTPSPLAKLVDQAPGALGTLTRWITNTARRPQPEFALAHAIAFAGAVVGRKVQGWTGLRTNLYAIAVGETSSGKDHSLTAIDRLAQDAGAMDLLQGEPASDSGLIAAVEAMPSGIFTIDEVGHWISNATGRNAASHQQAIIAGLIRLFTTANRTFHGKQYANRQERPAITIDQPNTCLFGTATPATFFGGLSPADLENGLLGRLLVFKPTVTRPESRDVRPNPSTPDDLIAWVRAWQNRPFDYAREGDLAGHMPVTNGGPRIVPEAVEVTDHARLLFGDFTREIDDIIDQEDAGAAALWGRAVEHAMKLATVAAAACEPDASRPTVDEDIALWATDLACRLIVDFAQAVDDRIAENEHETAVKRVLALIRDAGAAGLQRGDLTRKTQWLKPRDREGIIAGLIESGQVKAEQVKRPSGPKAMVYYAMAK